jgi:hypothetical protein
LLFNFAAALPFDVATVLLSLEGAPLFILDMATPLPLLFGM